jgi:hypothetical protein
MSDFQNLRILFKKHKFDRILELLKKKPWNLNVFMKQIIVGSPEEKLKSRMEIQIKYNKHNKMIVIAYFNYDSQRSDIEKFADNDTAYQWLFDRWGWILDDETPDPYYIT